MYQGMKPYTGDSPPPLYPRLPSAPYDDRKMPPPRPAYPPGGSPKYPPPGMHRPGPVIGAVPVLPTNPTYDQDRHDGRPVLPPKPQTQQKTQITQNPQTPQQTEVVVQPKVIVVTQKSKEKRHDTSSESEPEAPPVIQDPQVPNIKVERLRKRNYVFMALAGISFLLCLNVICGAIALVFAILAEMDLGHGKVKSGSAKSIVSIVLTVVGVFIAAILLTVFLVVHS